MYKLSILEEIILFLIHRYNGERTIQGLTYLLKGKQSAQIIQDSHFYQVTPFFGLYHILTQQNMQELVNRLENKGYIKQFENKNQFRVTKNGLNYIKNHKLQYENYPYLNGLRFTSVQKIFWKRFSLYFQTISNLNQSIKYFRAVIQDQDIQEWVKSEILHFKGSKEKLATDFYEELHKILSKLNEKDASLFVKRLSGANSFGMTLEQIAVDDHKNAETIYIQSINVLHQLLSILIDHYAEYPILYRFIHGENNTNITNTSIETKRLFRQGKSIHEIAAIRNLKMSTIEDHIVECVLSDELFPIDQFISTEQFFMIKTKINELNTRKLKSIKEALFNEVTYFQIRITLARMGDLYESRESIK